MSEAIFHFSVGTCGKICPCKRCDENGTPYTMTVDYDGTEYVLAKWEESNHEQNCVWKRGGFATAEDFPEVFGSGEEFQFLLVLGETTEDFRWILLVWDPGDAVIYQYSYPFADDPIAGAPDCTAAQTLSKTQPGGPSTVELTPGAVRGACCPCDEEDGSSGSNTCASCEAPYHPDSGPAPAQLRVTLFFSSLIPGCEARNGEYILDQLTACTYCYDDGAPSVWRIRVELGHTTLNVSVGYSGGAAFDLFCYISATGQMLSAVLPSYTDCQGTHILNQSTASMALICGTDPDASVTVEPV